jgi:phage terminase large subunit-like protein
VFSAAVDRDQAAILFREMEAILLAVPELAGRVNIMKFNKRIEVTAGDGIGSVYEALSKDSRRSHGLSPSLFVYDELARAPDRELLDGLITGMGKRPGSLGVIITTQHYDDHHPLSQLIDDAERDPSTFLQLLAAPADADIYDEAVWRECNPALGSFLDLEEMRSTADRAKRNPAFEPAFRNLRLNMRVDAREEDRLVTPEVWERGNVPLKDLAGRECCGGLDLSSKDDLTALLLAFPDGDTVDVVPFFWTPQERLENRKPAERDLFKLWIRQGYLLTTPGPTIRYNWVAHQIAELGARYQIKVIGYDRWRIADLKPELDDLGCVVPLEDFGQGYQSMAPAVDLFHEKALNGLIRHAGHPVLASCVTSAILTLDPAGNRKIDKAKSKTAATIKVDGAVALAIALMMVGRHNEDPWAMSRIIEARGALP